MENNQNNLKEQELLCMIENIEKCYDPSSQNYKFKYIFYNKIDVPFSRPYDFPEDLWNKSITSDSTMMPVILKGQEIDTRRKQQIEVAVKINESYDYLQDKIVGLKLRAEKVRSKISNCLVMYRKIVYSIYNKYRTSKACCNLLDDIYKINTTLEKRDKLIVVDKKNELLEDLHDLRKSLYSLLEQINTKLCDYEKKTYIYDNINRL